MKIYQVFIYIMTEERIPTKFLKNVEGVRDLYEIRVEHLVVPTAVPTNSRIGMVHRNEALGLHLQSKAITSQRKENNCQCNGLIQKCGGSDVIWNTTSDNIMRIVKRRCRDCLRHHNRL